MFNHQKHIISHYRGWNLKLANSLLLFTPLFWPCEGAAPPEGEKAEDTVSSTPHLLEAPAAATPPRKNLKAISTSPASPQPHTVLKEQDDKQIPSSYMSLVCDTSSIQPV